MKRPVIVHEKAILDLADAANWYENDSPGLGLRFLDEWERIQSFIKQMPHGSTEYDTNVRQCRMMNFPFVIMYEISKSEITIFSVVHTSRNPKLKSRDWK